MLLGIQYKDWDGKDLQGTWQLSLKINGVQVRMRNGQAFSKASKPLYNLSHVPDGLYEVYCGSWEKSISAVRTQVNGKPVDIKNLFSLDPVDDRLILIREFINPTAAEINYLLDFYVVQGHEGLVLRKKDLCLKVKKSYTIDLSVLATYTGSGRNFKKLGGFITSKGKVGGGFSDQQRLDFLNLKLGTIIEIKYLELTKTGRLKHASFVRIRHDK